MGTCPKPSPKDEKELSHGDMELINFCNLKRDQRLMQLTYWKAAPKVVKFIDQVLGFFVAK